jgi:hypothetical protein
VDFFLFKRSFLIFCAINVDEMNSTNAQIEIACAVLCMCARAC